MSQHNGEKIAGGLDLEAHQLFLFSLRGELSRDRVTAAKIRDPLKNADEDQKELMLRVPREIGGWEGL